MTSWGMDSPETLKGKIRNKIIFVRNLTEYFHQFVLLCSVRFSIIFFSRPGPDQFSHGSVDDDERIDDSADTFPTKVSPPEVYHAPAVTTEGVGHLICQGKTPFWTQLIFPNIIKNSKNKDPTLNLKTDIPFNGLSPDFCRGELNSILPQHPHQVEDTRGEETDQSKLPIEGAAYQTLL